MMQKMALGTWFTTSFIDIVTNTKIGVIGAANMTEIDVSISMWSY